MTGLHRDWNNTLVCYYLLSDSPSNPFLDSVLLLTWSQDLRRQEIKTLANIYHKITFFFYKQNTILLVMRNVISPLKKSLIVSPFLGLF